MNEEKMIEIPLYSPRCDFCMIAPDDSMQAFGIHAGDVVELRQCDEDEVKSGDLVAVCIDGEALLRCFHHSNEFIVLSAFGIPSDIFRLDDKNRFEIRGEVIASRHIIE